ncbi:hypothetical protein HU200_015412 [Digitaria exilis]|uniref:Peroxidase n=1 Tax=Digitaria exilis TaxID=1010633 RepID=A0A835FB58_9POAL|nr:hypothetical protein HU200_015412 [Digitaria exilis]
MAPRRRSVVAKRPLSSSMVAATANNDSGGLSLETIVRSNVDAAIRQNVRLTAGLLRVFFHDCFPQVRRRRPRSPLPPNVGLQQEVLQLIEDIRGKVHAQCGATPCRAPTSPCWPPETPSTWPAGPPSRLAPASRNDVSKLPPPTASVDQLLSAFKNGSLDGPADLVALSGAHTVGKAHCNAFQGGGGVRHRNVLGVRRDLDFLTPTVFDNLYFVVVELTLRKNKGVMLPSDQGLATDPRTSWLVQGFADNHWWFFDQFKTSMIKMSQLRGPQGNVGEVRRNCFRRNSNAAAIPGAADELASA